DPGEYNLRLPRSQWLPRTNNFRLYTSGLHPIAMTLGSLKNASDNDRAQMQRLLREAVDHAPQPWAEPWDRSGLFTAQLALGDIEGAKKTVGSDRRVLDGFYGLGIVEATARAGDIS